MRRARRTPGQSNRLPQLLRPLFWTCDFDRLSWKTDRDLIIGRILAYSTAKSMRWLGRRVPDAELREWLITHRGACLGGKALRYWGLIFDIPKKLVDAWMADPAREKWNREYAEYAKQFDVWPYPPKPWAKPRRTKIGQGAG